MLIKEIKAEAIYVMILWIIITWGIAICDLNYRLSDDAFCDNWEYNLNCPIPDGFDNAMFSEPEYRPKYRMKNKI